jgi:hypothetical protein
MRTIQPVLQILRLYGYVDILSWSGLIDMILLLFLLLPDTDRHQQVEDYVRGRNTFYFKMVHI